MGTISFSQITDSKKSAPKETKEPDSTNHESTEPNRPKPQRKSIEHMAASLPSASKSRAEFLRGAPRVQFGFSAFPGPLKDDFDALAEEKDISKKALMFEALRLLGLDVPKGFEMDQRRRGSSEWDEFKKWKESQQRD